MTARRIIAKPGHEERDHDHPGATPPLRTIDELAGQLGTTPRHVRRLVAERRIPCLKVGWFVRVDPDEIAQWLDASRRDVESPGTIPGRPQRGVQSARTIRASASPPPRGHPYPGGTLPDRQGRRIRG